MLHIWSSSQKGLQALQKYVLGPLIQRNILYSVTYVPDGFPKMVPGDTLFALGGRAVTQLQKISALPKNRTITSLRGVAHPVNGKHVFVGFDPTIIEIDPTKKPQICWDVQSIARWCRTGTLEPVLGFYRYVEDFVDALVYVRDHGTESAPALVSLDLETSGLDEFAIGSEIVSVAVTYQDKQADVYVTPQGGNPPQMVLDQIKALCQTKRVKMTGANLKFDARWLLQHWGIQIENQTFDTCLVGSLLDENRSNNLNAHTKEYAPDLGGYDDSFNKKYDKGQMRANYQTSPEDFLTYSGGDTDACYRITGPLRQQLVQDKALTNFYVRLLQPASRAFQMLEHRGVVVDLKRYDELEAQAEGDLQRISTEAIAMLPQYLRIRYRDNLSLTRAAIIRDFLFTPRGLGLPIHMKTEKDELASTALEHLEMHESHPEAAPFIALLREFGGTKKTLSTYIVGFRKHIRSDGRFHPSYMLHRGDYGGKESGTITGRLSAKDPAWQTLPKHTAWAKLLRSVFIAPPGHVILKLDYSQGELKVTACLAREPTMIETYRQGIDLHLKTGASVYGMTLEEALALKDADDPQIKIIRQGGKAGNFGLIYEMGPEGFQEYARKTYGVALSMTDVKRFINTFFGTYKRLRPWHEESKDFAKKHGYIRSPLGRVRHLPGITSNDPALRSKQGRQAINSPVQSTLSDLALLSVAELHRRYPDLWVFGSTHDEVQMYVPEDEVELWANRVAGVMSDLPLKEYFGWSPQLRFTVDAEYSATNLAECVELPLK